MIRVQRADFDQRHGKNGRDVLEERLAARRDGFEAQESKLHTLEQGTARILREPGGAERVLWEAMHADYAATVQQLLTEPPNCDAEHLARIAGVNQEAIHAISERRHGVAWPKEQEACLPEPGAEGLR